MSLLSNWASKPQSPLAAAAAELRAFKPPEKPPEMSPPRRHWHRRRRGAKTHMMRSEMRLCGCAMRQIRSPWSTPVTRRLCRPRMKFPSSRRAYWGARLSPIPPGGPPPPSGWGRFVPEETNAHVRRAPAGKREDVSHERVVLERVRRVHVAVVRLEAPSSFGLRSAGWIDKGSRRRFAVVRQNRKPLIPGPKTRRPQHLRDWPGACR
jgi:hypothetical protein